MLVRTLKPKLFLIAILYRPEFLIGGVWTIKGPQPRLNEPLFVHLADNDSEVTVIINSRMFKTFNY